MYEVAKSLQQVEINADAAAIIRKIANNSSVELHKLVSFKRKSIVSRIGKCQLKLNLEVNLRLVAAVWRHLLIMAKDEAVGVKKLI